MTLIGLLFSASVALAGGDTLTLVDGKIVSGDILFFNDTECAISVNHKVESFQMNKIRRIDFGPTTVPSALHGAEVKTIQEKDGLEYGK